MTLIKHELRQGAGTLAVWTAAIGFLLAVCVFLFPEMKGEMDGISELFASMGSFTAAFGMDRLNFGTFTGFYAVECGNILGLGGAFFASLAAAASLAKEERDKTAEFLLTHPVSRAQIVTEKLCALLLQILMLNLVCLGLSAVAVAVIGEPLPWKEFGLLHLAYFLLQLSLAGVCFGLSSLLRRGSLGAGLGLAAMLYFLNLIANIAEGAKFLKYLSPFAFAEGADIVANGRLDAVLLSLGMAYAAVGIAAAYGIYGRKDIH